MDPLHLPARHAPSSSSFTSDEGPHLPSKASGELLFLISDFLASVPGGDVASRQLIQSAHDAGVLPMTRTYKGTMRRITPGELGRAAGSVQASGLLTIVQDWIRRHGLYTLLSAPSQPQPRPPHSIVDNLRLRQTQAGPSISLASTMRKFEQIGSLFGHTHETYCIMFDRTQTRLITGSNDWIIKIWCAQTGWLLHSLRGHLGPVDYLTINRENTMIASGCHDGAIRIWALATGRPVATLRTPQVARHPDYPNAAPDEPNARINRITAIVWSTTPYPENRLLVAATKDDGMLRIWRWVRGPSPQEPARFLHADNPLAISFKTRDSDYPVCLSMDPSGLFLAAGGSDGVVRVYSTGPLIRHRFEDPPSSVFGAVASASTSAASALPGGLSLLPLPSATGSSGGTAATMGDDPMDVSPPTPAAAAALTTVAAADQLLPPPTLEGTADHEMPTYPLLQLADIPCIAYLKHDGPLVDVQFSNKGDRLLAYAEDGQAHVWSLDTATGEWIRVALSKDPIVPDPALAPANSQPQPSAGVASQQQPQSDLQPAPDGGGTQPPKRKRRKKRTYDVVSSCWLEGDNYLVTTNMDGFIRVFESRSGQLVNAFRGDSFADDAAEDPGVIDTLEPHPQMPDVFLTACSSTGYVALWHRLTNNSQPLWARKHNGLVSHCDISADGWTIAVSMFTDELDATGSQVTKLYAIAREPLVAPEEQFFPSDRDNMDHTAMEPWLYGHTHPYYEENPTYVRPRNSDAYPGQPPLAYRTSLPAGMPFNQLAEEDLTAADQAKMLVSHVFAHYRVVEMTRDEIEAHARAHAKKSKARRIQPASGAAAHFQALLDVEPVLALPIIDVDDPDDEDYHEGSDAEGGVDGADAEADDVSADEHGLASAFHEGSADDDVGHRLSSTSTARRRNLGSAASASATTPSPSRRSRRRATQNSQAAEFADDDDPAFQATLREIMDQDSGDDYEAPTHFASSSSAVAASGGRRLVRRGSSTGSNAHSASGGTRTRLRRSASNQSAMSETLDSPSQGTRSSTRRTRATNHMYDESLTRGLDMSDEEVDMLAGDWMNDDDEGRPRTRASRLKRQRLHALDESADENVPIPSTSSSSSLRAQASSLSGAAAIGTRRSKRRRVGSEDDDDYERAQAEGALSASSSSRSRRGAAVGRGSPGRNRSLRIFEEDSEEEEEEEAVATSSDSSREGEGELQDETSSVESRPRRRSATVTASSATTRPPARSASSRPTRSIASASASSSTSSLALPLRLTRRSSSAFMSNAHLETQPAAASSEPPSLYPSWMYATSHDPYSYAPQLGDCVAVFPDGYATFLDVHRDQCQEAGVANVYSKARIPALTADSTLDHFFAIVQGIKVQPGSLHGAFQIELTLVRCDPGNKSITIRYEGTGFPDFIQLRSRLKYALEATSTIQLADDVRVMGDDGSWGGTVIDLRSSPAVWGRFHVQWDEPGEGDAESDWISPWEIQGDDYIDSRDASERLPDVVVDKVKRLLRRIKHIPPPADISHVVPGQDRPISTNLISDRLDNDFYRHPQEMAADLERLRRSASSSGNREAAGDRERLAEVIQQLSKDYPLPDAASVVLEDEQVVHSGYDSDDQGFGFVAGADGVTDTIGASSSVAGTTSASTATNGRGRSAKARAATRIAAAWNPSSSPDPADLQPMATNARRTQSLTAYTSSSRTSSVSTVSTTQPTLASAAGASSRSRRTADTASGSSHHVSVEIPAVTRTQSSIRPSNSMSSISTMDSQLDFDDATGGASWWAASPTSASAVSRSAAPATSHPPQIQRSSDMEDEFVSQAQAQAAASSSAAARSSGRGPSTTRRVSSGSAGSGKFPHRSSNGGDWFAATGSSDIIVEDNLGTNLAAHRPRRAAVAALQGISHATRGITSPPRGMLLPPRAPKRKSKRLSSSGGGASYAEWESDGREEEESEDSDEPIMEMSSEEGEEEDIGYVGGRAVKRARYN